jgi:hypothetical protein
MVTFFNRTLHLNPLHYQDFFKHSSFCDFNNKVFIVDDKVYENGVVEFFNKNLKPICVNLFNSNELELEYLELYNQNDLSTNKIDVTNFRIFLAVKINQNNTSVRLIDNYSVEKNKM